MPDLQAASVTTGGPIFQNPSLTNVAPRIGFAWDVTGDGKNVIHGGGGYFFEPILSNVYRAYGNRTPPYYNSINPANPTFPNPPITGATSLLRLDLVQYHLDEPVPPAVQLHLPARPARAHRGHRRLHRVAWL